MGPEDAHRIAASWDYGFAYIGDLSLHSAAYIAGYVTKKMTDASDKRLLGRYPEFARMSLRPGIGAHAIETIAASLRSKAGKREIERLSDVPNMLLHSGSRLPLGRYLRNRLRKELGRESKQSDEAAYKCQMEMLKLYQAAAHPGESITQGKIRYDADARQRTLQQMNLARIKMSAKGIGI
jgi:hypothetical protein